MAAARELISLLLAKVPLIAGRLVSAGDVLAFFSVLLFAIVADSIARRRADRYRSRAFRVDLIYAVFYLSGVYTFFVGLPWFRFLTRVARSAITIRSGSLSALPVAAQVIIGLIAVDLFSYAWHRSVHANRFLWAFHSVHHSQKLLTVATGFRTHFVDEIVRTTFLFVPLYLLNIQPHAFIAMDLVLGWILGLQHSDLTWSYGPLRRVFVSPRYHRMHHSIDPAARDKNFAVLFPVWDTLFGTATAERTDAMTYGLAEGEYPESFLRQVAVPFIVLAKAFRAPRPAAPPAAEGTYAVTD